LKRAVYSFLAVAAIGGFLWWLLVAPNVLPDEVREHLNSSSGELAELPKSPPRRVVTDLVDPILPPSDLARDLRTRFRASNDYWEFAEQIIRAAKQGDGASQYYLGVALNTCEFLYRYYFMEQKVGARPRVRTLDEAQQLTATRQGSGYTPDDVRELQSRCQRIMATSPPPFGTSREWMAAARNNGYPVALPMRPNTKPWRP